MDPVRLLRPSPSVRSAADEDGAVLLDIEQNLIFTMDPVGSLIWNHVKQGDSKEIILETLVSTFPEMEQPVLERDLNEFFEALVAAKVVAL